MKSVLQLVLACIASMLVLPAVAHAQLVPRSPPRIAPDCAIEPPSSTCRRTTVSLDARFGVADAPAATGGLRKLEGYGLRAMLTASHATPSHFTFGFSLPATWVSLDEGRDGHADAAAWGNPRLSVRLAHPLWRAPTRQLFATTGLSVGLPLAARSVRAQKAQALASALDVYREQMAFLPGFWSVTPSVGLEANTGRFGTRVLLELPLAVRMDTAPPTQESRTVGLMPTLSALGRLQALRRLEIAVLVYAVFGAPTPLRYARRMPVEVGLESSLAVRTGPHHTLGLSFTRPLSRPLGRETFAAGLQSSVHW